MNKQSIAISRAFGKVVVTVHGDVDGQQLARTLADLAEDPGNLHLIIDLRDADSLDPDSLNVLSRSSRHVQDAGGELVLAARSLAVLDALKGGAFTVAESGWVPPVPTGDEEMAIDIRDAQPGD
jgi:anti-anti-sigma factor